MTHNEQNIPNHHAGDALRIVVTVEDTPGDIVDVTGASGTYLIKEDTSDPDSEALVEKTTEGGGVTMTDPENGEVEVKIETDDTAGMTGQKHHRLRLVDTEGDRSTVFTGTITIIT